MDSSCNGSFLTGSASAGFANGAGDQDGNAAIATFESPLGLAIADNGDIIVADSGNKKIGWISHQ